MQGVSESLAGRVGLVELYTLSQSEVKRSSSPRPGDLSGAATIPTAPGVQVQPGIVLCTAMEILPLGRGNYAYPISMI